MLSSFFVGLSLIFIPLASGQDAAVVAEARRVLPQFSSILIQPAHFDPVRIQSFFASHPEALLDDTVAVLAWRLALSPVLPAESALWQRFWRHYLIERHILLWNRRASPDSLTSVASAFVQTDEVPGTRDLLDHIFQRDLMGVHPQFLLTWVTRFQQRDARRSPSPARGYAHALEFAADFIVLHRLARVPIDYYSLPWAIDLRNALTNRISLSYERVVGIAARFQPLIYALSRDETPLRSLHRFLMRRSPTLRLVFFAAFRRHLSTNTIPSRMARALGRPGITSFTSALPRVGSSILPLNDLALAINIFRLHSTDIADAGELATLFNERTLPTAQTVEEATTIVDFVEHALPYAPDPTVFLNRHFNRWCHAVGLLLARDRFNDARTRFQNLGNFLTPSALFAFADAAQLTYLTTHWSEASGNATVFLGMLQTMEWSLQAAFPRDRVTPVGADVFRHSESTPPIAHSQEHVTSVLYAASPVLAQARVATATYTDFEKRILNTATRLLIALPQSAFDRRRSQETVTIRDTLLATWNTHPEIDNRLALLFTSWGLSPQAWCAEAQIARQIGEPDSGNVMQMP